MKKNISISFLILSLFFSSSFSLKINPFGVKVIVIDAGHGGKDPGCHGKNNLEKDVALAVALKLGKYIQENLKDVKVVYTRKTDVFVELQERAEIANREKADLFISIHCNSACVRDKKARKDICRENTTGAETFVMGIKNEQGNLNIAKRENSAILLEDNYVKKYDGFDPNSDESYIIMSMFADTYLDHSLSLATKIQKQYCQKIGRCDRGVKRASLWVLWRTAMPSVLTEIGYLTNPSEERFLGSETGQKYIASGLFRAFREYKDEIEGITKTYNDEFENQEPYKMSKEDSLVFAQLNNSKSIEIKVDSNIKEQPQNESIKKEEEKGKSVQSTQKEKASIENQATTTYKNVKQQKNLASEKEDEKKVKEQIEPKKTTTLTNVSAAANSTVTTITTISNTDAPKGNEGKMTAEEVLKNPIMKIERTVVKKETVTEASQIKVPLKKDSIKASQNSIDSKTIYKVLVLSSDQKIPLDDSQFKGLQKMSLYAANGVYKYTSGEFSKKEEAFKYKESIRTKGFPDAFVIATKNGERIPLK